MGGAGFIQPALYVIKHHLAAIILDEVADEFIVQIDIESSGHALLFFRGSWRRQGQLDSQGMQDCQRFSDLAGFLALFEVNDEPQPCSGGQSQIFLRYAKAFARGPDELTDLLGRISQSSPFFR